MTSYPRRAGTIPLLQLLYRRFPDIPKDELYARLLCGEVRVDGSTEKDPKALVKPAAELGFSRQRYVSRGGDKLESAFLGLGFPVTDKVFVDAGSSTGGFTHFLLLHGARSVHAVDVGYNQLDYSLRTDPRVIVHERTNILSLKSLDPRPDAAVGDLSFRSLRGVVDHVLSLTSEGWGVFLLKPQFELNAPYDDFNGIVSDDSLLQHTVEETLCALADDSVLTEKICRAGIKGRKGNQEYLVLLRSGSSFSLKEERKRIRDLIREEFSGL
ncbi:SAM-dependent methyltransferase [Marispirochaeta aestuarii]|uniref:TlyA family RNA methyltransferase n=1 Tax=Marispirochaeta aestuarii TaxID=1963862 RepID=UPI0029C89992|nr:SAM-dependent methyltransferase [Marispirochaeta aestuarii]